MSLIWYLSVVWILNNWMQCSFSHFMSSHWAWSHLFRSLSISGSFLRRGCAPDSQHGRLHRWAEKAIAKTRRNWCDPPEVVLFGETPDWQDSSAGHQNAERLCCPSDCEYKPSGIANWGGRGLKWRKGERRARERWRARNVFMAGNREEFWENFYIRSIAFLLLLFVFFSFFQIK